jgi:hypothetical protein
MYSAPRRKCFRRLLWLSLISSIVGCAHHNQATIASKALAATPDLATELPEADALKRIQTQYPSAKIDRGVTDQLQLIEQAAQRGALTANQMSLIVRIENDTSGSQQFYGTDVIQFHPLYLQENRKNRVYIADESQGCERDKNDWLCAESESMSQVLPLRKSSAVFDVTTASETCGVEHCQRLRLVAISLEAVRSNSDADAIRKLARNFEVLFHADTFQPVYSLWVENGVQWQYTYTNDALAPMTLPTDCEGPTLATKVKQEPAVLVFKAEDLGPGVTIGDLLKQMPQTHEELPAEQKKRRCRY